MLTIFISVLKSGLAKVEHVTHFTMVLRLLRVYHITDIFWLEQLRILLLAGRIKMDSMLNVGSVGTLMAFQLYVLKFSFDFTKIL